MVVTEEQAQKAFDFMNEKAEEAARARAQRIYLEEYRKVMKSNCMKKHEGQPVSVQEREAYADPEYKEILKAMRDAIAKDEWFRWMNTASSATLDAWRTESANKRGEMKVG